MTTNEELLKELTKHGEILARLDERTDFLVKAQDRHDGRLTYLERRDTIGTIANGIIGGITAVVLAIHAYLSGGGQ